MSSFDELDGDGAEREWDAAWMSDFAGADDDGWDSAWSTYTSGVADAYGSLSESRVLLELPIGTIELVGDDVGLGHALPAAAPGSEPRLHVRVEYESPQNTQTLPQSTQVQEPERISWTVTDRVSGTREHGTESTPRDVLEAIILASIRMDDDNVYTALGLLDNGSFGVGLVGLTGDHERIADLALDGSWRVLSESLVAIRRNSRTVRALRLVESVSSETSGGGVDPGFRIEMEDSSIDALMVLGSEGTGAEHGSRSEHGSLADREGERASEPGGGIAAAGIAAAVVAHLVDHSPDSTEPLEETVAGAEIINLASGDLGELPEQLTRLSEQYGSHFDSSDDPVATRVRRTVSRALAAIEADHELPAVLAGPALDLLDRGKHPEMESVETVDFLVKPESRSQVSDALVAAGFEPASISAASGGSSGSGSATGMVQVFEPPVDAADGELAVTISSTLASGPFAELVDMDDFHDLSISVRAGEHWLCGLHPGHRYIEACLRLDRNRDDQSARIRAVANVPRSRSAARRVARLAARCGAVTPVRSVSEELEDLFPVAARQLLEELH